MWVWAALPLLKTGVRVYAWPLFPKGNVLELLAADDDSETGEFIALQDEVEERLLRIEDMRVMLEDRIADIHERARATRNKRQMQPVLADVQSLIKLQSTGLAEIDQPCRVLDTWLADYTAQMSSAAGPATYQTHHTHHNCHTRRTFHTHHAQQQAQQHAAARSSMQQHTCIEFFLVSCTSHTGIARAMS